MKLPKSSHNWVSVIGSALALFSCVLIVVLLVVTFVFNIGSSYLGLFIYIILPIFLIGGLVLIPIGMFFRKHK